MSDQADAELAKKIAVETVNEVFLRLGVDISDHDSIFKLQKDFAHLRESREGKEEFIKKSKMTLIGAFISGALAIALNGILHWGDK